MADEAPEKTREQQDAEAQMALRNEYVAALKACKPMERKWLLCLMRTGGEAYEAGRLAGIGKATVFRYLRTPQTMRVFTLTESILVLDLGVSMYTQQREYKRQGYAKLRDAYYPKGHPQQGQLMSPHEWDEDTAAAICEHSYDKDGRPTIKMHAKGPALAALDRLRNLGPPQRVELTGKDGEPLNSAPAVMVVPGMVTEEGWAAAAAAQQAHLKDAEGRFVEPSRVTP